MMFYDQSIQMREEVRMNTVNGSIRPIKSSFVLFLFVFLALLFSACAQTILEEEPIKKYTVCQTMRASIDYPFLIDQTGTVKTARRWVGVAYSADGWKTEEIYSPGFLRKKLIYSGKSGDTIEISYRDFRNGLAAASFFQNIKYDLSESNLITFQNFQIHVISADNNSITYAVIAG